MVNMYVSAAVMGLAGAAAAAAVGPTYPETQVHKGFRLVVNVTDPSSDFHRLIHNTYISVIHDGNPDLEALSQVKHAGDSLLFYLNGTHTDHYDNQVLTESFSDHTSGIGFDPSDKSRTAHLYPGRGDAYFSLIHFGEHLPLLHPETWIACKEKLQRNRVGGEYIGFRQIANVFNPISGRYELHVPDNCAPVRLLPECAKLNKLPKRPVPVHEHAVDAHCYPNVAAIDWRKYASE